MVTIPIPRRFADYFVDVSLADGRMSFVIEIDSWSVKLARLWAKRYSREIIASWNDGSMEKELADAGFRDVVSSIFVDPKTGLLTRIEYTSGLKAELTRGESGSYYFGPDQLLSTQEFACLFHIIVYWSFNLRSVIERQPSSTSGN